MKQLLLFLSVLFSQKLNAQSILRLQHITVEDGLSQNSVNHILQDAHGFMWFATGDGLDRYDGKDFVVYKSRFNDTLASQMKDRNINSSVFEDRANRFWMSTDAGLSFMNTRNGKYKVVIDYDANRNAAHLLAMDSEYVWASVLRIGVFQINATTLQKTLYPFTDSLQLKSPRVFPIYNGVTTAEGLWIADDAGLLFFDKKKQKDERLLHSNDITSVNLLHDGRLLLTAVGGIYFYNTGTRNAEFVPLKNEAGNKPMIWESCAEDEATHTVYLGCMNDGAIGKFNLGTRAFELISFQNNPVNCLFIDRSQNLWVGTEGNGLFKLDIKQPKFFCYAPDVSVIGNGSSFMAKSIYRDDSGKIWIGTYNNGLIIYDPVTQQQKTVPLHVPIETFLVSTLFKDSAGYVVAAIGSYILWLDRLTGSVKKQARLPLTLENSPEDPIIFSMVEWKKGHYLLGTNLSFFSLYFEGDAVVIKRPRVNRTRQHVSSYTYNLHLEKDGVINVGKRSGYLKIRMLQDTVLQVLEEAFDRIAVRHFYKSTRTPVLWIATEKGLVAYNTISKKTATFDESAGLANSCVYAILPQNDSMLWISTNKGLSFVKVHYVEKITADFINYTSKDGLQSNEFNTGAYYVGKDGTLYFGGIAGINWFNPVQVKPNVHPAQPAIAEIFINDSLFAWDTANYVQVLELPYKKNTVSFSLRALEFTRPDQNHFAYMLVGLDKDWVYTANDRVRYSNLRPGEYTFMLKASNNEGVWNEEPLTMKIIIHPPFWETWWFRLLSVIVAVAVAVLSIRLYVRQKVRARTRELEKQQLLYKERLRISKDVHDDLGSGLSKISLMAELAKKKVAGDANLKEDIQHISSTSKELVDNMRDLIWVLNPENTTLEQLVARLREYCADYLEHMPIDVTLRFPDIVPQMRILREAQRNIFLTSKEAINNCIKHAQANQISISLAVDNNLLNIRVQDNGKGFDMTHLKGRGNGLRNMKQRIEQIGGAFNIASVPGNTTISITVPFEKLLFRENTTLM
ncbi:MAG: histidine kinase [Flavipsychrobacter sp.]|jgi:signal transduction histidine kinase/ligand-binding sensor domain-containing protein|nr:histidine kinase [Flavipsychrobacter sp.]